jgi:hypothetical protein
MSTIYYTTIRNGRKVRLLLKNTHRYVNYYGKLTQQCATKSGCTYTKINLRFNKIRKLLFSRRHGLNSTLYFLNNKNIPNNFFSNLKLSQTSVLLSGYNRLDSSENPALYNKTKKIF